MITKPRLTHIDGLRGIAVLFVVIYHFFPNILRGGFAGVDVFFVISGYVIQRQLSQLDRFSFREFYSRRVIRIFPSLAIVIISVLILSQFFFLDYPLRLLLNSVIASSVFSTNYYFFASANYFDISSISKPLLPLWSLAVEEQFYLLWPFIFWFTAKRFRLLLSGLILSSFFSAIYFASYSENYNFYSLQTRFWEIALGIFISSLSVHGLWNGFKYIRSLLLCMLASIVLFGYGSNSWPNFSTVVVVAAATLVILSPGVTLNRFLSSRLLLFFGRISFPLYLVHWPLLSFYSNFKPAHTPSADKIILLVASVVISLLLYKLVEYPIQQLKGRSRTYMAVGLSFLLILSGVLAFNLKSNLPESSQVIRQSISSNSLVVKRNPWFFSGRSELSQPKINYSCYKSVNLDLVFACEEGVKWDSVNALVVGDSKAEIIFRALLRSKGNLNWGFIGGGLKPIIPLTRNLSVLNRMETQSEKVSSWVASQDSVKQIVIVSATRNLFALPNDFSLEQLNMAPSPVLIQLEFLRWLKPLDTAHKVIYLVRDNPTLRDPTYCHGVFSALGIFDPLVQTAENTNGCFYKLNEFQEDSFRYRILLASAAETYQSVKILDSTDFFCSITRNRCDLFKEKRLLYSYTDHMSDFAADYVARKVLLASKQSTL